MAAPMYKNVNQNERNTIYNTMSIMIKIYIYVIFTLKEKKKTSKTCETKTNIHLKLSPEEIRELKAQKSDNIVWNFLFAGFLFA